MTEFLIPGERVILPGYEKTLKTGYGSEQIHTPTREGLFVGYADSGVRRGTRGVIVKDVKEAKPLIAVGDQEMFDPMDVGIPATSQRLSRISNLVDCCIEHLEALVRGDDDAKEEAEAFLKNVAKIQGVGPHGFRERYSEKKEG